MTLLYKGFLNGNEVGMVAAQRDFEKRNNFYVLYWKVNKINPAKDLDNLLKYDFTPVWEYSNILIILEFDGDIDPLAFKRRQNNKRDIKECTFAFMFNNYIRCCLGRVYIIKDNRFGQIYEEWCASATEGLIMEEVDENMSKISKEFREHTVFGIVVPKQEKVPYEYSQLHSGGKELCYLFDGLHPGERT